MWVSEIIERSIRLALENAGSTTEVRLSRVCDKASQKTGDYIYPCYDIACEGGSQQGNIAFFYDVPCEIMCKTYTAKDVERTVLAGLEDLMRTKIDAGIKAEFDSIRDASGETWYYKGIVDLGGGSVFIDEKEQVLTTNMIFKVCRAG